MAIRYAVASGNWSTGSTWDGGTLPTSGDDVYVENKVIAIDVTGITVANIYNTLRSGGTVFGGYMTVSINNVTITSNLIGTGAYLLVSTITAEKTLNIVGNISHVVGSAGNGYTCIYHNGLGTLNITGGVTGCTTYGSWGVQNQLGATVNISGNITGGNGANAHAVNNITSGVINATNTIITGGFNGSVGINNTSTGTVNITGTCISGPSSVAVDNASTGTMNITGNQTASGTTGVFAIRNSSAGILRINGNILGALATTPSLAYVVNNSGAGIVNINGSVIQQSIGPSASIGIVNNNSTGIINVNGSVGGGSVANSIGISNSSTGTINVTGNITGGTNTTMTPAIYSTTAGIINVSGETVSGLYPALYSTSTTAINRLKGNIKSFNGLLPFVAFKINCDPLSGQTITIQDIGNTDRLFSTSNVSNGAPLPANVRSGIVYGSLNEFTGSTIIATPDNVRKGVLTDNTVGTGQLTAEDFLNAIATGTDPLSIRLQNVSTVQSTGDQISNY